MRKLSACLIVVLALATTVRAQWECPSQLAAFLKPVGNTGLYWGSELTGGAGYLDKNWIANGMGLVGIDWSNEKSTFYLEGGLKYWNRYDIDASKDHDNAHIGIRELYYQYKASHSELTVGVQSSRLEDDYLLNERVLGANLKLSRGKWTLNMFGGTVTKDFARNGTFCNVGYLYDIMPGRQRSLIGNSIGDTNLASLSLKYQPGKQVKKATSGDEFSSDEFSQGLDSPSPNKADRLKIESIGAIVYHEFGDWIATKFVTTGLFARAEWGNGWSFKPEILFQAATDNNAMIYSFRLEKMLGGENSKTNFSLRYLGKTNIDNNAHVLNSFSNIFAGDVIRLDAIDLPFIQAGLKYSLPKQKIHFKTQLASQVNGNSSMKELDFEAGKRFGKHLQVNALSGIIRSNLLNNDAVLGRIEFRYNF